MGRKKLDKSSVQNISKSEKKDTKKLIAKTSKIVKNSSPKEKKEIEKTIDKALKKRGRKKIIKEIIQTEEKNAKKEIKKRKILNLKKLGPKSNESNNEENDGKLPKIYLCFIQPTMLKLKYRKKLNNIILNHFKDIKNKKKYQFKLKDTPQVDPKKENQKNEINIDIREIGKEPDLRKTSLTPSSIRNRKNKEIIHNNEESSTGSESNELGKNKRGRKNSSKSEITVVENQSKNNKGKKKISTITANKEKVILIEENTYDKKY